ncbi:MAG TPA: hypothetical protein PKN40_12260 [Chitinophagales bacterium]|nr:hypothetical protein [Chitinophagales bacterium]
METEQKNTLQELEDAGSTLPELLRRNTMRVPEGYFEGLEDRLINQVIAAEAPKSQTGKSLRMWMYISAAASVLIVAGIVFLQRNTANHSLEMQFAKMSDAELDNYINEQIASLSSDDIYNYLSEEIHSIEASDILSTELVGATDADEHFQEAMHEQVYPSTENGTQGPAILDEELLEDIDDVLLQEYLNNAAIFEDMAL